MPVNYAPETPPKKQKKELFPEDVSPVTESDENTSMVALPITKPRVFKFRDFNKEKKDNVDSPSSSPLPWPSPILISSDEELEKSMCELEGKISLEMGYD